MEVDSVNPRGGRIETDPAHLKKGVADEGECRQNLASLLSARALGPTADREGMTSMLL